MQTGSIKLYDETVKKSYAAQAAWEDSDWNMYGYSPRRRKSWLQKDQEEVTAAVEAAKKAGFKFGAKVRRVNGVNPEIGEVSGFNYWPDKAYNVHTCNFEVICVRWPGTTYSSSIDYSQEELELVN